MYKVYQVQNGETLDSIANKFGVSVDVIKSLNGIVNNVIPGTYLVIPQDDSNKMFTKYIVQKGDNIYAIARKYNVSPNQLLILNGLNATDIIYPNQEILVPNSNINMYVTAEGDTLNKVLKELNTDANNMQMQNSTIYLLPDQLIVVRR